MQDSLYTMIRRSYEEYYTFMKGFVPENVEIICENDVKNTWIDGNVIDHKLKDEFWTPKKGDHKPLFLVQLTKNQQGDGFAYSSSPEYFKTTL